MGAAAFCQVFRGGGWGGGGRFVGEVDLDLFPDDDPVYRTLDDVPALLEGEGRPAGIERACFHGEVCGRKLLDLEEVDLPLESRDLGVELAGALLKGAVTLSEALSRQAVLLVKAVELVHFNGQPGAIPEQSGDEFFPLAKHLIPLPQILGYLNGIEEELSELLVEDPLQIYDRDLVATGLADPLRGVRGHVHLGPVHPAERHAGEELDGGTALALGFGGALREVGVALVPEFGRDDGWNNVPDPFAFGLDEPFLPVASGVIGAVEALGNRVLEDVPDGRFAEGLALACPVPSLVEEPSHPADPAVDLEKLKDELEDRGLFGVRHEPAVVLPEIAEGCFASHALPELGPDRDRGRDPRRDLLPFPFGERGDEGVEEAAGRATRVYGLRQGDEVGALRPEDLGEL